MIKKFIFTFLLATFAFYAQAGLPPTSMKFNGEPNYSTTFNFDFSIFSGAHNGVVATPSYLLPSGGGTGLTGTPTNGQLLIGNGSGYTLNTLTGTANQVNVTNGAGSITLSTPQDIATTSSPTFSSLTLTNPLTLANGGTEKALTAVAGGIVWTDADSMEISAAGTSGYLLQSNGTSAPSWSSVSSLLDTNYFKQLGNSFGADASLGTNDTFGMIFETDNTRRMYLDDTTYSVFFGSNSLTTGSSSYGVWIDNGTGQNSFMKYTSGAATGTASTDGFDVGYLGVSGAYIWNNEATVLDFGTSNTQRMQISAGGLVSIGATAPTTSAKLDIQGTDGALLLPRLTTTQKNALTPANGMIVYDTTLGSFQCYDTAWGDCTKPVLSTQTPTAGSSLTIDLTASVQRIRLTPATPLSLSTTVPFGSSAPKDGALIILVGTSDTNTLTLVASDTAKGIVKYGKTLGRGDTATYLYSATDDRYYYQATGN